MSNYVEIKLVIASELMTREVVTVGASDCVGAVVDRLNERNIRHVPVMRDGRLVGVLSDRDLKAFMLPADEAFLHPDMVRTRLDAPAENIIQGDLVTVEPDTDVAEVIDVMLDYRLGAVAVVSPKSQQLVGIISYTDILRVAQDSL
jgi:acetoin utilization protein AcuB